MVQVPESSQSDHSILRINMQSGNKRNYHIIKILVEQIGAKIKHDTAFCDEELKSGTIVEETNDEKQHWPTNIDHNYVIQGGKGGGGILCISSTV